MDIGAALGLVIVWVFVVMAMLPAGIGAYIDVPSFMIVVMGTIGIIMGSLPFNYMKNGLKATMKAFFHSAQPQSALILQLVDFAVRARRDGILSLESAEEEMKDEFLKKGIRLAVDGTEPDVIAAILETDLENMEARHASSSQILGLVTEMAPAMGMIGTLIGLVAMLQSMSDPASIGPAMAVALITTLYGAMMANMFSIPMTYRIQNRSKEEVASRSIMLAGIMSIQAGDNPRIVEQKLNAFLPPKERSSQFD
ncbi:MAG: motility protein A [Deferribacteraceae bacterium]|jgi:chemotaxis protein MotA|nr:motility protein A [Deferribacteraceae bacterium]